MRNLPKVTIDGTRMVVLQSFIDNFELILHFSKAFTANFEKAFVSWVIDSIYQNTNKHKVDCCNSTFDIRTTIF